ncbi:hypothetical protein J2Z79_002697 [Symbiobacterium terraclitae]|uniref:Uncharacterized protein n=1 Tax=Symbiobacterium terraclitae TaxID=557451 RepID=A0ABS4JUS1_9FIRM|nr:hypothetical protein [Symbiobacterium terraclitae]MBP2019270.1 hypothetical protein [Symbiobacterium terraclitae]
MASTRVRNLLRQLFRTVRRLDQAGVSENLILAVVFFALSRNDRGALVALTEEDDD